VAPPVPTFRHARRRDLPRAAPVLSVLWAMGLAAFVSGVMGAVWGRDGVHGLADAFVGLTLVWAISAVWAAWVREERYPRRLPEAEYARRFPPSTAAPPVQEGDVTVELPRPRGMS
jgi:hypothetical protein